MPAHRSRQSLTRGELQVQHPAMIAAARLRPTAPVHKQRPHRQHVPCGGRDQLRRQSARRQHLSRTMRPADDRQRPVRRRRCIEMNPQRQHRFQHLHRRLAVVHSGPQPRPRVTRAPRRIGDSDRQVLVPRQRPRLIRRLVKVESPHQPAGRTQHSAQQPLQSRSTPARQRRRTKLQHIPRGIHRPLALPHPFLTRRRRRERLIQQPRQSRDILVCIHVLQQGPPRHIQFPH